MLDAGRAMEKPKIRTAKFADIPGVVDLGREALGASRYSAFANLNEAQAKKALMFCIQNQGDPKNGKTFVAVADNGICLEGLIIGAARPLYECLDTILLTDLLWYARASAHATTGLRLLKVFHRWCAQAPDNAIIRQAVSDSIADPERTAHILQHAGMRQTGAIYEKGTPK